MLHIQSFLPPAHRVQSDPGSLSSDVQMSETKKTAVLLRLSDHLQSPLLGVYSCLRSSSPESTSLLKFLFRCHFILFYEFISHLNASHAECKSLQGLMIEKSCTNELL